ncbi:butyrophilin subfamily 2 member A1-like [Silurus meridionalis]|uniref:butyrophilin subfamily 2 member A1-like n=1 Tax=Silurus meridionalis TaxID=175797 RepID=UPI001EE9C4BD|nr:butyrophilin subfamily 2 member A1-like [Silurus meridionalis]
MTSALPLRWFSLLLFSALIHQTSSGLFSVKVQSPVSGLLGSSVSLPCSLENILDARHLEVRWYRPKLYNTPALFYKDTQIQKNPVDVQYQGRVFLLGDLENGDVSMKLENLTLADRGDYVCHVSSDKWYDEATVSLRLRVVGSTPVRTLQEAGAGKINVSCHSNGWLPEPLVIWTDKDGRDLKHLSKDKFTSNTEGLVDVSSWMIVSPSESEWISCSVSLSGQETKVSRTALFIPAESRNGYLLLIPIVLLMCAAGIIVYCVLRKKGLISKEKQKGTAEGTLSETEPLNQACVKNPDENDSSPVINAPDDVVVDIEQSTEIRLTPSPGLILKRKMTESAEVFVRADLNHVKSSELQNSEAVKNKPQAADSGGEQRGCSSLPVFSTAGSATDKPNFISNTTPAACISETIQTSTPSNPTLTSISSNPTYTSTSSSPTLTFTSLNPTFTTTSSKHSSTPLTTTP